MTRPHVLTAAALTAAALLSGAPPGAHAADRISVDTYRTTVSLDVGYEHRQASGPATQVDAGTAHLDAPGPVIRFDGGQMGTVPQVAQVAPATVPGHAIMQLTNPEGTSSTCTGDGALAQGSFGIGPVAGPGTDIWFAPWVTTAFSGRCDDGGGAELAVAPTRPARPDSTTVPSHGVRFQPSLAQATSDGFSLPFRVELRDAQCPGFEPSSTTTCVATWSGTVRFARIAHAEQDSTDADSLLEPPRRTKDRKRVKTTVRCRSRCDVELLIGVFGMRHGKPYVTPVARVRRSGLAAGKATTLTARLSAADRRRLRGGRKAVASLTVSAEGRRGTPAIFPLR